MSTNAYMRDAMRQRQVSRDEILREMARPDSCLALLLDDQAARAEVLDMVCVGGVWMSPEDAARA